MRTEAHPTACLSQFANMFSYTALLPAFTFPLASLDEAIKFAAVSVYPFAQLRADGFVTRATAYEPQKRALFEVADASIKCEVNDSVEAPLRIELPDAIAEGDCRCEVISQPPLCRCLVTGCRLRDPFSVSPPTGEDTSGASVRFLAEALTSLYV